MSSTNESQAERRDPRAWRLLAGFYVLPFILLIAAVVVSSIPPEEIVPRSAPSWAHVQPTVAGDEREVILELTWEDGPPLVAPAWSGTVTAVNPDVQTQVATGQRVLQIDSVWRIALHSTIPFYRPLDRGATGEDARALNNALATLGMSTAGDVDTVTSRTVTGVRELAASLGVSGWVSAFDPAWVIWIPADTVSTAGSAAAVGAPAPAQGEPVLESPPHVAAIALGDDGDPLPEPASFASYDATIEGTEVALLEASEVVLDLVELTKILVADQETATLTLQERTPDSALAVPSSAVFVAADGSTCVFVRASNGQGVPTEIVVIGTEIGVSLVDGGLQRSAEVMVNPAAVEKEASCDST